MISLRTRGARTRASLGEIQQAHEAEHGVEQSEIDRSDVDRADGGPLLEEGQTSLRRRFHEHRPDEGGIELDPDAKIGACFGSFEDLGGHGKLDGGQKVALAAPGGWQPPPSPIGHH